MSDPGTQERVRSQKRLPLELYTGNHTGLAYCRCPSCGPEGSVILQVVRANHIQRHREETAGSDSDEVINPPMTFREKVTECHKIRDWVKEDMKKRLLRRLERSVEKGMLEEGIDESELGMEDNQTEDESRQLEYEAIKWKGERDAYAEAIADAFMAAYYPDHRYGMQTARELYGPSEERLKEAYYIRFQYKRFEIKALWKRLVKVREEARRRELTQFQEGDDDFLPAFMKELGLLIWLTRHALTIDAELVGLIGPDKNWEALGCIRTFYVGYTAGIQDGDFMDCDILGTMDTPTAKKHYLDFLAKAWNRNVNKRIRAIASDRVSQVNESAITGADDDTVD